VPAEDDPAARVRRAAWWLVLAFALHEAEEWNILAWYRAHYADLPGVNDLAVRTGLVAYVAIGALWTLAATRLPAPRAAALAVLPLAIFLLVNAIQHVYWTAHFAAYGPGIVTAVLIVTPAALALVRTTVAARLVPPWYVGLLVVLALPTVVATVTGDAATRQQLQLVNDLGARIVRLF
jgi:hypothetical protein